MSLLFFGHLRRQNIITATDPSIFIHLVRPRGAIIDMRRQKHVIILRAVEGVETFLLLSERHLSHLQVLLHGHHLPDILLLQVYVFLFNLADASWVIDVVWVQRTHVLSLHSLIVLPVVADTFLLELAEYILDIPLPSSQHFFLR